MIRLLAGLLYGVVWLLSLPPLRFLYLPERPAAWILRNILGYRKHIIRNNLSQSFPEKSGEDLLQLEKEYYRWMYRLLAESLKAMHWSANRLARQIDIINPEILHRTSQSKDVIILAGHTGNWEWIPGAVCQQGLHLLGVYKPQTSAVFDRLTQWIRTKKQVTPVPMKSTIRLMQDAPGSDNGRALLLIADQIPARGDIHFWHPFLNHDTAWFTGAEKIAEKKDLPVLYLRMNPIRKGRYRAEFLPLRESNEPSAPGDITRFYIHALEATIRANPAYWLWSHRRWKHRRDQLSL